MDRVCGRTLIPPFAVFTDDTNSNGRTAGSGASAVSSVSVGPAPGVCLDRPSPLVGRDHELAFLTDLIGAAGAGAGNAMVLLGQPGMGKTSLLHVVGEDVASRGIQVVSVRGVESEAVLPFAVAADLLLPFRAHFSRLPLAQCEALEVSLALARGDPAAPLAVCAASLGVITTAAEAAPLVVLIDDYQWVDSESAQVLAFIARRIAREPIAVIFAVRDEPDRIPPLTDLPQLVLTGLSTGCCGRLLEDLGRQVSSAELSLLAERTGGNPLAVIEFSRALAATPPDSCTADLDRPAHAHHQLCPHPNGPRGEGSLSLHRTWGRLWSELPADSRVAVFIVAVAPAEQGLIVVTALARLGLSLEALLPAEERGLVAVTDEEIRVRHPLMRSIVVSRTPWPVKTSCYQALADTTDGHLRTWYLAAAAPGPDEELAAALVDQADEARRRHGLAASARALRRAADLTLPGPLQARRLVDAASDAQLAGDPDTALKWCDTALTVAEDPRFAVEVQTVAGWARIWLGHPATAYDGFVAAAERAQPVDSLLAAAALCQSVAAAEMIGRLDLALDAARTVERIWDESGGVETASLSALALVAVGLGHAGELSRARRLLDWASALAGSPQPARELTGAVFLCRSLLAAERLDEARRQLATVLATARRLAAPAVLAFALSVSADVGWWTGRWSAAHADAAEALQWADQQGQPVIIGYGLSMIARLAGARGDFEACRAAVSRLQRDVEPGGGGCHRIQNEAAQGLASLGTCDLGDAISHLGLARRLAEENGMGNPNVVPFVGDLAEALARADHVQDCRELIEQLTDVADRTLLAYPRAAALRARGILTEDVDEAERWFDAALALAPDDAMPFEAGRTLLAWGESLRRRRRLTEARDRLERARMVFERLGARPWARRALAELAATGARTVRERVHPAAPIAELSPQEMHVARAAGRGLSNAEIGELLFLSQKTVEAHLTRIYRKLDVRSRTQLTRVLLANGITD